MIISRLITTWKILLLKPSNLLIETLNVKKINLFIYLFVLYIIIIVKFTRYFLAPWWFIHFMSILIIPLLFLQKPKRNSKAKDVLLSWMWFRHSGPWNKVCTIKSAITLERKEFRCLGIGWSLVQWSIAMWKSKSSFVYSLGYWLKGILPMNNVNYNTHPIG